MASEAVLIQNAVTAVLSEKGGKAFNEQIKKLMGN